MTFHTDATIYRGQLDADNQLKFDNTAGRRIFIYLTAGELTVDGLVLNKADQARVDTEKPIVLEAGADAEFVLIDVPSCKGWGYSDKTLSGERK